MDSYQHPMPKTPELSYINFSMAVFSRGARLQDPPPPPQRIFNAGIFLGIQNNLKIRGQCPRITAA